MKKVKVTKRPKMQEFVLRPSRLRMIAIYIFLFALALGVGFLIRLVINPGSLNLAELEKSWIAYVAILLGAPILLAVMDFRRWTLRILDGDRVEGPAGPFGERLAIGLDEIDWERTKRSLSSWLKMGNAIYASRRERILLNPWFYPSQTYVEFLDLIGFNKRH